MKFKGHLLKVNGSQYTMKQQLSQGGFSLIYSTNKPDIVCKVQVISQANIAYAYNNEKTALTKLSHKNIVKLVACKQQKINDSNCGFMLLQNCSQGNAFDILDKSQGSVPQPIILAIMESVTSALQYIHEQGFSHRDIKLQNVLRNANGDFKLCDFGSCMPGTIQVNKSNRTQIEDHIEKTTTPIYRCPQQLDLYSGFSIGPKVDVFALGVLGFIICFKKQPFQTRLSAINNQYFLPQQHAYSSQLIRIIQDCFTCNPKQRPSAKIMKQRLRALIKKKKAHIQLNYDRQLNQTADQLSHINQKIFKQTTTAEASFLSKIRKIYNQITTETEGWIISFIEDNQQAPNLKFNRSIISKCWEKRYKVQKFYSIIWRFSEQSKNKSLVTLKLLTLLHNFLRKGPTQTMTHQSQYSPIKLCEKIYMHWKVNQRPTDQQDIKRNSFIVLLIRMYCIIIIGKVKLCFENSDLIEGNYSILPFFTSKEDHTILKIPIIQQMIRFLQVCTLFHEQLQRNSYLIEIQRTILLSMVDQQYCLVSTLTFILSAFKHAIKYVEEDLDEGKLTKKLNYIQKDFKQVFLKLMKLFKKNSKLASLFEHNQFQLNPKVVEYISDIQITKKYKDHRQFSINRYLNYKNTIHGLKIPLTYQQVVKNPQFLKDIETKRLKSKEYIEINQYKAKQNHKEHKKIEQDGQRKSAPDLQKIFNKQTPIFQKIHSEEVNEKNSLSDFSSFTLQINQKPQTPKSNINEINKDIFKTMQFTHQNLNQDFISVNNNMNMSKKQDKFADFLSIVEQKYEGERLSIQRTNKQNKQNKTEDFNMITQQVKSRINESENTKNMKKGQQQIKKIQLINFFDDDQDQTPKKPSPIKNQQKLSDLDELVFLDTPKQPNNIPQKKQQKRDRDKTKQKQKQKQKVARQQKMIEKQKKELVSKIKQVNIIQEQFMSSKTGDSFIDLKQFIVGEVKKNAEQYFIDYTALRFRKKIGFGHSSQVFKGEWRGRQVAIKKIKDDISTPNAQKQFKREIMTSVKIRHHPQLVTLIGIASHDNFFYIINEYCNGATLFDILHESKVPLPWKTRISIAKQITTGMLFLHTNEPPIIHRDLKSLNVLLVNKYSDRHPESMQIKIADFGLSRDFASTYMTGVLGTYHWMAPQIFNNQSYTLKADVYSFAIVLWEIVARRPPYLNMKNPQAIMKFVTVQNGRPDMNQLPADCPNDLKKLIIQCWDKQPNKRPDFQQILQELQKIQFF